VDALMLDSEVPSHLELQGEERLGSLLATVPSQSIALELGKCNFQWNRVHGVKAEAIIGKQLTWTWTISVSINVMLSILPKKTSLAKSCDVVWR